MRSLIKEIRSNYKRYKKLIDNHAKAVLNLFCATCQMAAMRI